jgi:protein O-mannosyl-transferase
MYRATLARASSFLADAHNRMMVVALALIAITLTAYYPIRHGEFINYDDMAYVYNNHRVQQGLTAGNVAWAFKTTDLANWHPLTWLSHMADVQLFGTNPAGHHATSFFLHLINVLLLFWVLCRMSGLIWRGAFVSAVFAVHPLNVESVAWVSERKNVLSTLFALLTVWAYVTYTRKGGRRRYLLVVVLFVVGLLTKPMLVTLPFVLLLLDFWPLGRTSETGRAEESHAPRRRRLFKLALEKAPLFALSIVSSLITLKASASGGAMAPVSGVAIRYRLTNAVTSYAAYLYQLVWPTRLAPFYPHPGAFTPPRQVMLATLVLVAVTSLVVWRRRSSRYLAVGWLWYLVTLLPVIGLIQVGMQARADRYVYVPMIGILITAAWGAAQAARRLPRRDYWLGGAAVCVLVVLTFAARRQVTYWQSSEALWSHAIQVTDNNFVAHTNLAMALNLRERYDEAIEHCNTSLEIAPNDSLTYATLGEALSKKGRPEEGIPHLYKALRLTADRETAVAAQRALGEAMVKVGNDEKAIHHFSQALRLDPLLAPVYADLGALFYKSSQFERAVSHYRRAAQLAPSADSYNKLASVLRERGRLQEAAASYREALKLEPGSVETQKGLASLEGTGATAPPVR